jgi:hypothetical protein
MLSIRSASFQKLSVSFCLWLGGSPYPVSFIDISQPYWKRASLSKQNTTLAALVAWTVTRLRGIGDQFLREANILPFLEAPRELFLLWDLQLCDEGIGNTSRLRYEPNRLMVSTDLWRWYINITITILDIIHRPVFYLKHDCSETGFCLKSNSFCWVHLSRFHLKTKTKL